MTIIYFKDMKFILSAIVIHVLLTYTSLSHTSSQQT